MNNNPSQTLAKKMKVDCHVHSFPLAIPGNCRGIFTPAYSGIKLNYLELILKKFDENTGMRHGVFLVAMIPELSQKSQSQNTF